MKKTTGSLLVAAFLVSGLLAACEEPPREGPVEQMGKKVDEAAEDAGEAIEEAGEDLEDAAD